MATPPPPNDTPWSREFRTAASRSAILQIDAAGSALNLQAANRIIMLEPSWTPGANHQAVARAVRIGQRNPVLISWPVVRHSIDESVMRVLRRKQDGLDRAVAGGIMMRLDAIREMIMEARRSEAAARPFPSGVAAGDNRAGFLNASEAGRCTRWLWYDKHGVAGENASSLRRLRPRPRLRALVHHLSRRRPRARRRTPALRRRQAKAAGAARLSPRRHTRRADRMAGPVGDACWK